MNAADVEAIANAIELARLKIKSLRQQCKKTDPLDVVEDIELALGWLAKKVEKLQRQDAK